MGMTRERVAAFGAAGRLKGIVTEPASGEVRRLLILPNAGFVPKYGPHRVYVQLARRLAAHGYAVLRFDLGGLGESLPTATGLLRARTLTDLAAAADFLGRAYGAIELASGGICSAAEDSLRFAEVDPRVRRLYLVDPFAYRTAGWGWRHARHRLWRRSLRTLRLWRPGAHGSDGIIDYRYMERGEAERILGRLCERAARVHFIYTGGRREVFNHASQLWRMFPGLPLRRIATVDHLPQIEHTQFVQRERDLLIDASVRRLIA